MAWTTPKTWTHGDVIGASDLNTHIRDNLNALRTPEGGEVVQSGTYTTNSTSWADVDGTNIKTTLTPATAQVTITAMIVCEVSTAAYHGYFTVDVNGTDIAPSTGLARTQNEHTITIPIIYTAAANAGASNTYKLRFKSENAGGTLTVYQVTWRVYDSV